jgi:hypothetical protein
LPYGDSFGSLDRDALNVRLIDIVLEFGLLNLPEADHVSAERVNPNNQGFEAQNLELSLSGTVSREFFASVTAGIRHLQRLEGGCTVGRLKTPSRAVITEMKLQGNIKRRNVEVPVLLSFERQISSFYDRRKTPDNDANMVFML